MANLYVLYVYIFAHVLKRKDRKVAYRAGARRGADVLYAKNCKTKKIL